MRNDAWPEPASGGGGGRYLRLKQKGESARIRIVTPPMVFWKMNTLREPPTVSQRFAFGVVETVTLSGSTTFKAKAYEVGVGIYTLLKDLIKDADWGEPSEYDLKITRTEASPQKFYSVVPVPKKPLPPEAEDAIEEAQSFELKAMFARDMVPAPGSSQDELPPVGNAPDEDDEDPFAEE